MSIMNLATKFGVAVLILLGKKRGARNEVASLLWQLEIGGTLVRK
jgi:hypothetical protein